MVTYDRYGHCVVCHKNMVYEQVIGQKVTKRFSIDYSETEYMLDDGSRMRVAICKPCKEKLTDEDIPMIMECVKSGWVEEVKTLPWAEEKKKEYLDKYSKLEIVCPCQGLDPDILEKKHKEYKEAKNVNRK